jgi:tetraacyldisaccharide 4'-kinase
VRLDEPSWWYSGAGDIRQRLLAPLGQLYGWIAERRYYRNQPYRSRLPIICVGNFTAGGTGKTPLSMAIARLLIARGERPVFLTRGYGGTTSGPSWVDDTPGAAKRFGDEPLLLAAVAPTMVARDRRAGIIAIEGDRRPLSVVIMDDGLQNGSVTKDLSIALVDGKRGIGNGEVIPAGPLRAPLDFQIGLVDAIVVRDPPDLADERGVHAVLRRGRHRQSAPVLPAARTPRRASGGQHLVPRPPPVQDVGCHAAAGGGANEWRAARHYREGSRSPEERCRARHPRDGGAHAADRLDDRRA